MIGVPISKQATKAAASNQLTSWRKVARREGNKKDAQMSNSRRMQRPHNILLGVDKDKEKMWQGGGGLTRLFSTPWGCSRGKKKEEGKEGELSIPTTKVAKTIKGKWEEENHPPSTSRKMVKNKPREEEERNRRMLGRRQKKE
jgi:hypothetical protein